MVEVIAVLMDSATSIKSDVPGEFTVGQSATALKVALVEIISKKFKLDPPFNPETMMTSCYPSSRRSFSSDMFLSYIYLFFSLSLKPPIYRASYPA